MSISKGDKLPAGQLLKPGANGPEPVDAADLAAGRVAIFAVPGAYTPTCSNAHMPSFGAWASDTGATSAGIEVLADADGSYTKALGMNIVGEGWVNGRSKRYAMLVDGGVVTEIQVEESPGACSISSGDSLLDLV